MARQRQITIRVDEELYEAVKLKCKTQWGMGMSPLIKVFLRAFVTQQGVGFYVGDQDLAQLFNKWLIKKVWQKGDRERGYRDTSVFKRPRLKDLYELQPLSSPLTRSKY